MGGPEHHAARLGRCSRNRKSQNQAAQAWPRGGLRGPPARPGPHDSPEGVKGPWKGGLQFLQSQLSLAKLHTWALKHQ